MTLLVSLLVLSCNYSFITCRRYLAGGREPRWPASFGCGA